MNLKYLIILLFGFSATIYTMERFSDGVYCQDDDTIISCDGNIELKVTRIFNQSKDEYEFEVAKTELNFNDSDSYATITTINPPFINGKELFQKLQNKL